ncbi:glycosyltransferase family 39 protein [bacterium]|nr:glycosyltransferase family 39 protein [bacterium]
MLVAYAFLKRVLFLGDKCFWWDEFLTEQRVWYTEQELFEYPMTARALIYSYFLKLYAQVTAAFTHNNYLTEFQLRLPHAIAGTLAILVIYKIGKQLKDQATGLILAFLAAFSPFLIIYAREARFYPFVLLLSACLIHAVILIIGRQQDDNKKALLYYAYYSLTAILGMHTHQGFWLLFAASNVFLTLFEIIRAIKQKKADPIFFIQILWLLTLPIITAYFCIDALLTKGANSDIIKAAKLVPSLDLNFFKTTHQELWEGIRLNNVIHFLALAAAIILLIPKKTRTISIYLLTVSTITFIALRNMGTFKEPFRVKYITFIWLVEAIALTLALTTILDFLLSKLSNKNLSTAIKFTTLFIIVILSLATPIDTLKLPQKEGTSDSYRSLTKTLNSQIQPDDIIVSYEEGLEALKYYQRVYASDWKIIGAHQLESQYSGNYVYDGYAFALFHRNTAKTGNNKYLTKIADAGGYSLYKSNAKLDPTLQNNLLLTLIDGFREKNYLPIRNQAERLYYTSNYLKNGNFENELKDWTTSEIDKDYMAISVLTTNNTTYLNVTNNYNVALVLSQTVDIPAAGKYSLVFKTHGFYNGGHFTIKSDDVNQDIYRAEITNPMFPRFHNFTFTKPQKVKFHITVKPDGYAALYSFGLYKLEKR